MHLALQELTSVCRDFVSGMTSRDFRGIFSIQEVECLGENLDVDVKLISLQLFKLPEPTVLASLNVISDSCMTFSEFSSCMIHPTATHKSRVRILVHDLEEGERREYGCTATTVTPLGNAVTQNWKLVLKRSSKPRNYCSLCIGHICICSYLGTPFYRFSRFLFVSKIELTALDIVGRLSL